MVSVCVCVTLGLTGHLSVLCRGAEGILEVRHFKFAVICNLDADCTYLRDDDHHLFPFAPLKLEQDIQPLHRLCTRQSCVVALELSIWSTHRTCTCPGFLGFSLRLACGTAFTSVRISISVSLLVRAQGDPVEWPLWTR